MNGFYNFSNFRKYFFSKFLKVLFLKWSVKKFRNRIELIQPKKLDFNRVLLGCNFSIKVQMGVNSPAVELQNLILGRWSLEFFRLPPKARIKGEALVSPNPLYLIAIVVLKVEGLLLGSVDPKKPSPRSLQPPALEPSASWSRSVRLRHLHPFVHALMSRYTRVNLRDRIRQVFPISAALRHIGTTQLSKRSFLRDSTWALNMNESAFQFRSRIKLIRQGFIFT